MRIMTYNIAYGTGNPGAGFGRVFTSHRYLRSGRRSIDLIADFAEKCKPDLIGLVEADLGSFRTGGEDQVRYLAETLNMTSASAVKYSTGTLVNRMPIIRKQANALLSHIPGKIKKHYMPAGFKRMALEVEFQEFHVVLVHLALTRQVRRLQLDFLENELADRNNLIVGGDFNTFAGEKELARFKRRLKLRNPNTDRICTYPSWRPLRQLDYLLFSENIEIKSFSVPKFCASDHLPVIADFEIRG